MAISLKEIFYKYARERGGGLPLTAEEFCNALALWVEQYLPEETEKNVLEKFRELIHADPPLRITPDGNGYKISIEVEVDKLLNLFTDSATITFDTNEDGDKIEARLSQMIINRINNTIPMPVNSVSEDSVPVIKDGTPVRYVPLSGIGGGSGEGTKLYKHDISFNGRSEKLIVVSPFNSPITNDDANSLLYISMVAKISFNGGNDFQGSTVIDISVPSINAIEIVYGSLLGIDAVYINLEDYPIYDEVTLI